MTVAIDSYQVNYGDDQAIDYRHSKAIELVIAIEEHYKICKRPEQTLNCPEIEPFNFACGVHQRLKVRM